MTADVHILPPRRMRAGVKRHYWHPATRVECIRRGWGLF